MIPSPKTLDDIIGAYGPDWTTGVLAEHTYLAEENILVHVAASGRTFVTGIKGGSATPVLCGEIVPIPTEDGIIDGRCGAPVYDRGFACPGHEAQINAYRAETDRFYYDE